ncbi:alpha-ketoacid dehydrogenase kinase N-terminal domain-containing protein [Dacryopinax primogenitus]|uniref:Protein-serine/threonine kinase n=1 Tax=Dacryopinax primogenitus (strain DJM 731) TaxID=1858805 RepID=M5G7C1_DACPD|nr:alpha-ketoacid dehydrogenase kinase N-terminal domain-containing protein [Dacryopinax primogenitus]EJU06126.1 alpha-ketoacid dehydrogenase kinase N-terminal domain-containing protein [Dacryopinax primogenitus]
MRPSRRLHLPLQPIPSTSSTSAPTHFYRNRQLELYASKRSKPLSLRQLIFFGRSMNEERLIQSANYVRTELPVRLAHRIRDLQTLPFVVVRQEQVAKVYELYWTAFERVRSYPPIHDLHDNERFCEFLQQILDEHAAVIPMLSLGFSLSSQHLAPELLDTVLRRMLVSRISRRVVAQHHVALSRSLAQPRPAGWRRDQQDHVGIISTALDAGECIRHCVELLHQRRGPEGQERIGPEVKIDGDTETKFAYIREHLEYPIFELLKNSFRFTRLAHPQQPSEPSSLPPIQVTLVNAPTDVHIRISDQGGGLQSADVVTPSDLYSFSHLRNKARLASDRLAALKKASMSSRGMMATVQEQLRSEEGEEEAQAVEAASRTHLGIGLPMSKIYAEYFRGGLHLVSLDGYGVDAYLRLPKLGTMLEDIEV